MSTLGISSLDEKPSPEKIPEDLWLSSDCDREDMLNKVCQNVLDNYCSIKYHAKLDNDELDMDHVQLYASDVITMGLLYMEFSDAIREGDGPRIIRCYRYMLPLLRYSGRTNYSNDVLLMLYNFECTLSPRQAEQLQWCRTVNTVGLPGHNIPCDLYVEHLNRLCKDMIKGMGANKTQKSVERIGRSVGHIQKVLSQFDVSNNVSVGSGTHSVAELAKKDTAAVIKQLMESKVFQFKANRYHKSFKESIHMPITMEINKTDFQKWMVDRLKHYTLTNLVNQN